MKLSNILICSLIPATSVLMLAIFNDASTVPSMLAAFLTMLSNGLVSVFHAAISVGTVVERTLWSVLPSIAAVLIGVFVGIIKHRHDPTSTISAVLCGLASCISLYVALPFLSMPRGLSLVLILTSTITFSIFMGIKNDEKRGNISQNSVRSQMITLAVTFVVLVFVGGAFAAYVQSSQSLNKSEHYTPSMTPADIARIDAINMPILLEGTTEGALRAWLTSNEALQAAATSDEPTTTNRTSFEIPVPLAGYEKVRVLCKNYGSDNRIVQGRIKGMWWSYPRVDALAERLCILRKDEFHTTD